MRLVACDTILNEVVVELSRRNLLSLLAKLDGHPADSACTIFKVTNGMLLTVTATEDPGTAGGMHSDTEERISDS